MDTGAEKSKLRIDRSVGKRPDLFGIVAAQKTVQPAGAEGASGGDAGPGTVFHDGGGAVLNNVHVQLIFWGTSWATVDFDLRVEDVVNAVITLLDSPYMSGLEQYRVTGSGTLVGSLLATDSDPPAKFKDTDVMNEVVALVSAGKLPSPSDDPQLLYCVILPAGVSSAADANFAGEHLVSHSTGAPDRSRG